MSSITNLVSGPSKFDLMTALFVWKPERHEVIFVTRDGTKIRAHIGGCSAEDGSGESWNLRGYGQLSGEGDWFGFEAYFRTSDRKGWIKIT